jgi:transposase
MEGAMNRFWLTDEQFAKIEPHLPTDTLGKCRVDDRRVISGIVDILKLGGRWVMELRSGPLAREREALAAHAFLYPDMPANPFHPADAAQVSGRRTWRSSFLLLRV